MKKKMFVLLFILSLIGPTAIYPFAKNYIDETNYENRTLASFPEISRENFLHLPMEFEEYYNDHVPFKNYFVRTKTQIDKVVFGIASIPSITIGRDDWLFYTVNEPGEDALADYQHTNLYSVEQENKLVEGIHNVEQECRKKGTRFYMFVVPNKEVLYSAYMPERIKQYGEVSRMDRLYERLKKEHLPFLYLKDCLNEYKEQQPLYFKTDTHWNSIGAYVASQKISEILTGKSTPLEQVKVRETGKYTGDLKKMLNVTAEFEDDFGYEIDGYMPEITFECVEASSDNRYVVFQSNSKNDKTLLVVGDSFTHMLKEFLPKCYKKCVFVTMEAYQDGLIEQHQADDFIYLTVERNQRLLENAEEILNGTYDKE